MTEILQECVRIGKKTVARNRHLIYSDLLLQIEMEMNEIKASRRKGGRSLDSTTENITSYEERVQEIAQTKWLDD